MFSVHWEFFFFALDKAKIKISKYVAPKMKSYHEYNIGRDYKNAKDHQKSSNKKWMLRLYISKISANRKDKLHPLYSVSAKILNSLFGLNAEGTKYAFLNRHTFVIIFKDPQPTKE